MHTTCHHREMIAIVTSSVALSLECSIDVTCRKGDDATHQRAPLLIFILNFQASLSQETISNFVLCLDHCWLSKNPKQHMYVDVVPVSRVRERRRETKMLTVINIHSTDETSARFALSDDTLDEKYG